MINPWKVDSIEAFNCLICPKCIFITKVQNIFEKHAVDNHPLSHALFGISNDNLYDFIKETEANSEFIQDTNRTTLNTKSNFEAYLAKYTTHPSLRKIKMAPY